MAFLVCSWLIVVSVAWLAGTAVLGRFDGRTVFSRIGDRFVLAV